MDAQTIERYGDELYQSLLSRIPVEPLTNRESDITVPAGGQTCATSRRMNQ